MSAKNSHSPSSLLPHANVAIFSHDEKTKKSAATVKTDWRFPRVNIAVHNGDISDAVQATKDGHVFDLIIIQTDTTESSLIDGLEELSNHCSENTSAIVLGPVNDVNLYRKLTDMGVSDYLVAPISAKDMTDVIARILTEKMGVSNSKLFAFVGAKGGVGTSTLAQATAWGAANILNQKTILIDGAGGWSANSVGMGFEPSTTLAAAVRAAEDGDEEKLDRMIVHVSENLSVLGSGVDVMLEQPVSPEKMELLTNRLMIKYPLVVTDLSGAAPDVQKSTLMQASRIAVIATPFLTSLRQTRSLIQEIVDLRNEAKNEIDLIINMVGLDKAHEVSVKEVEKALEMTPVALVNFASAIFMKSESEGKKIIDTKEGREMIETVLVPVLRSILGLKTVANIQGKESLGLLNSILKKIKK